MSAPPHSPPLNPLGHCLCLNESSFPERPGGSQLQSGLQRASKEGLVVILSFACCHPLGQCLMLSTAPPHTHTPFTTPESSIIS